MGASCYNRSGYCIGFKSVAAPRVHLFLATVLSVERKAGQAESNVFQIFGCTRSEIEPRLSAVVTGCPTHCTIYPV